MRVRSVFKAGLCSGYDEAQILDYLRQLQEEIKAQEEEYEEALAEAEMEVERLQGIVDEYDAGAVELKRHIMAERAASRQELEKLRKALSETQAKLWRAEEKLGTRQGQAGERP